MAATYDSGTNTIEVTGIVDMEDVYSAAHAGNWYDSNADPVVESPVLGMYFIRANLEIGDGSTATTLTSTNEMVWFDALAVIKTSATVTTNRSSWTFVGITDLYDFLSGGTLIGNDSIFLAANPGGARIDFNTGTLTLSGCILAADYEAHWRNFWRIMAGLGTTSLTRCNFANQNLYINKSGATLTDIKVDPKNNSHLGDVYESLSVTNPSAENCTTYNFNLARDAYAITVNLIDATFTVEKPDSIAHADSVLNEQYTINVHVTDKDGANLSGVTVNLEGSDAGAYDTDMWTADSITTDANGTISTESPATDGITAKKWVGTSETETDYNVFRMTLSKAGYETLVLENITIDSPIDWHLELQDEVIYPAVPHESDVRRGVRYGEGSARIGVLTTAGGDIKKEVDPMREEDLIMSMINMFLQDK